MKEVNSSEWRGSQGERRKGHYFEMSPRSSKTVYRKIKVNYSKRIYQSKGNKVSSHQACSNAFAILQRNGSPVFLLDLLLRGTPKCIRNKSSLLTAPMEWKYI